MSKQKYPQSITSATNSSGESLSGRDSYSSHFIHAKRDRKRREAEERQAEYDKLSIQEKMKHAGKKELAKLQKKLALQTPPAVKVAPMTEKQKSVKAVKRATDAVKSKAKAKK